MATSVGFEVASAQTFTGTGYDLVTTFDALHDMGDPVGAARPVREALAPDGTWLLVEPAAGDRVEDNLNPVPPRRRVTRSTSSTRSGPEHTPRSPANTRA